MYAICSDNNIVRTLSDFRIPEVVDGGIKRKRKVNGRREREQATVPCPHQIINYFDIFHQIDKGRNGVEAKYNLIF